MALFKTFRGLRASLDAQEKHDGYAYFCIDDGSFHIDYVDDNGVLQRKQINAKNAETLGAYTADEFLLESDIDSILAQAKESGEFVGEATAEGGEIFNDYENNKAGSMCYTITAIDSENKTYTLDSTEGLAINDIYSVHLYYSDNTSTQGENIGKITNINNNVVTVDVFYIQENKTFATKESYIDENGLDKEHNTFRIITKPLVGNRHIGYHSHAEGNNTKAQSKGAHAEGNDTIAFGSWSHSEGKNTQSAYSAHAEGVGTKALGQGSHAEGATTKAKGKYSHAEGHQSQANGFGSHAQGFATHSDGNYSSAEGYESKAFGEAAHAEGIYSKAYGKYSHAEGYSETGRVEGNDGYIDGDYAHAEGFNSKALAKASHAEGNGTTAWGNYSHTEGNSTETAGYAEGAHAEGIASHAYNKGAHAEGYKTTALGAYSHAEGHSTTVSEEAEAAHAEGKNTIASGIYSHAEGVGTQSTGQYSHAEGFNSIASGTTSHAGGTRTEASVWNSFAHGHGVKTKSVGGRGDGQAVFGQFNKLDGDAKFIIGNGTSDTDRSNAFVVKNDGTVFANDKELSTKEYVDTSIGSIKISESNKSLIFNTKANLSSWLNGTPGGKNLLNPNSYVDTSNQGWAYVGEDGVIYLDGSLDMENGGTYAEITYTFTTTEECVLSAIIEGYGVDIELNEDGGFYQENVTFQIPIGTNSLTLFQGEQSSSSIYLQLEKGTEATEYEPYIKPYAREDGITKEALVKGDLLFIEENNYPDYYWNGNDIIEIESKTPNIEIPQSNKSLIFDTKANLDSWLNGEPGGKNLLNPWDYTDSHCIWEITNNGTVYFDMEGPSGDEAFIKYSKTLKNGNYVLSFTCDGDGESIRVKLNNVSVYDFYASDENNKTDYYAFTINENTELEIYAQAYNSISTGSVQIQLEKGTTPTEYETYIPPYTREDKLTKEDLITGDFLLVEENNIPDYYWNGTSATPIESGVDLSNYLPLSGGNMDGTANISILKNQDSCDYGTEINSQRISVSGNPTYYGYPNEISSLKSTQLSFSNADNQTNIIYGESGISFSVYGSQDFALDSYGKPTFSDEAKAAWISALGIQELIDAVISDALKGEY